MARARRLGAGTAKAGLAIEYVRTRKVVRVLGWADEQPMEPVEIPVDELCQRLGIDPRDVVTPHRFLLFAGAHGRPGGGRKDLAGTFSSEEKAWAAFREVRATHPASQAWAELAVIDGTGQVNQLAWFGLRPDAGGRDEPDDPGDDETAQRRRRRRRLFPVPEDASPYLRAVTPS